jgi:hypothetical protein
MRALRCSAAPSIWTTRPPNLSPRLPSAPLYTFVVVLQVGDKAPDFKLPTTSGNELTLAEALEKYKALIFLFYVLDFTGG